MKPRIATIVRCLDSADDVYATLESIERQSAGGGEIVLVAGPGTPLLMRQWLATAATRRGGMLVEAASGAPGVMNNVGLRATTAPYAMVVDAGDLVERRCHELAGTMLDQSPTVAIATSRVVFDGSTAFDDLLERPHANLEALVAGPGALDAPSIVRRNLWMELGGFDETLAALDTYEFCLRTLLAGHGIRPLEGAGVVRPFTARTAFRRSIETPQYQQAIGCILAKHRAVFAANPAAALGARELALERVARIYSKSMRRRVAGLAEIEDLRQRAERLSATLLPESPSAVAWGDLRRASPLSLHWGFDRGTPIDRHYIEAFLAQHAADIRGVVLEVKDDGYTRRFGGVRVERVDVLDADARNGAATIVADLRCASNIPSDTYDCLVVTQTLHVIDDMHAAVSECHRVLRSGGVLLATLPCTSRVADPRDGSDCWRLTAGGARWLFSRSFDARALEVSTRGSVLTSVAFLHGISAEELDPHELAFDDPLFPLVVLVRAVKQPAAVKEGIAWQAE